MQVYSKIFKLVAFYNKLPTLALRVKSKRKDSKDQLLQSQQRNFKTMISYQIAFKILIYVNQLILYRNQLRISWTKIQAAQRVKKMTSLISSLTRKLQKLFRKWQLNKRGNFSTNLCPIMPKPFRKFKSNLFMILVKLLNWRRLKIKKDLKDRFTKIFRQLRKFIFNQKNRKLFLQRTWSKLTKNLVNEQINLNFKRVWNWPKIWLKFQDQKTNTNLLYHNALGYRSNATP